jgi:hypothetical protein
MRVGMRIGPFWISSRVGGRKRRRKPAASARTVYHARISGTGTATYRNTETGQVTEIEVPLTYQCEHGHRTQGAANECRDSAATQRAARAWMTAETDRLT